MRLWATGIAVLAVRQMDGEIAAMTVNSVTSVSLDPMLVLVCIHKDGMIMPHLREAPIFSLSFLNANQQDLSDYFAKRWQGDEPPNHRFVDWADGVRLGTCIGALAMKKHAIHEGGDHWIVVGDEASISRRLDSLVQKYGESKR